MLLELNMVPGSSLGAFSLGMPLSTAVAYVREKKAEYCCVEVKYSDKALLDQDLILNFPEHGMHLRFEPSSQRLRLIEVYDTSRMQLRYGKGLLGGASHAATALLVYELLGPTVPGQYNAATRVYPLHYPGLLFLFPVPPQHAQHCLEHSSELPLEFPDDTTPVASRICIYAGRAGTPEEVAQAKPPPLPKRSVHCQPVEAILGEGLVFSVSGQRVSFGDSVQDVCSELGSPSSTARKAGEPTSRMGSAVDSWRGSPPDYFYSYADRGIDILFDGASHRVKKLVLHANAPGHTAFNAYSKCNFSLSLESPPEPDSIHDQHESGLISSHSSADDLASQPNTGNDLELQTGHRPASKAVGVQRSSQGSCTAAADGSADCQPPCSSGTLQSSEGNALSDAENAGAVKGLFQGFLEDLVKSPTAASVDKNSPARTANPEVSWEWGGAQGWTKSLLDIGSDAFAFGGNDACPTGLEARETNAGPQTLPCQHQETQPADTSSQSITQARTSSEPGDTSTSLSDQRDGWDDSDTALLDLGLGVEGAIPGANLQSDGMQPTSRATERRLDIPEEPSQLVDKSLSEIQTLPQIATEGVGEHSAVPEQGRSTPSCSNKVTEELQCGEAADGYISHLDEAGGPKPIQLTANSCLKDIQAVMGKVGMATIHTGALGVSPFGRTHVHGYPGVAFEVMRNGFLASMTMFQV